MEWTGKNLMDHASVKRVKCPYLVVQTCLQTNVKFAEYLFIVGGSCFTKTELVSLSENEIAVPKCLSNLADHRNEIYYGAGGLLQFEG